jgi:hypothetical protein
MPDGAEIVSENGSTVTMRVTLPSDDAGHFGRQCPSCKRIFRMHVEDYEALPDDLRLTCPYCCAEEDHGEFMTGQQQERAMAAVGEHAQQLVAGMLDEAFSGMARRVNSRHGAVRMRYSGPSSRSVWPRPLPPIIEEAPIRERRCAKCGNRYAVFGEHVACPVCGPLPPRIVAEDAVEAQQTALAASITSQTPYWRSYEKLDRWSGPLQARSARSSRSWRLFSGRHSSIARQEEPPSSLGRATSSSGSMTLRGSTGTTSSSIFRALSAPPSGTSSASSTASGTSSPTPTGS